jgi:hypothetical protein
VDLVNENHFELSLLDPAKFIKANDLKEITNPTFFIKDGVPSADGLLSNEIFGITKEERGNTFAYIDLGNEVFIHPLCYKVWCSMDSRIREITHGTKKFIINSQGDFEENENGSNGIKFIRNNIDIIKIKTTESNKRNKKIQFLNENKDKLFMKQYIVIPAYYRDVNTNRGYIGVGEINKLYNSLMIAVRSLKETQDYGISMSNAVKGRIQEIILSIYDWFSGNTNTNLEQGSGSGLAKKTGIVRRANLSKTTDYASRLVFSAPDLKVEYVYNLMVDLDHSAVPLASICANFYPYMIFHIRRFFENEFTGITLYPYYDKKSDTVKYVKPKDPLISFSDERIKEELKRYMYGYSNRLIPVEVPNEEGLKIYMQFHGYDTPDDLVNKVVGKAPITNRRLTWCDIFYIAACEAVKDKTILITRYPVDSYFSQFPTKIVVSSTKETEAVYYNNTLYKHYPKIRERDIGSNTSNKFIDTLMMCNLYLKAIGGDYDGDQGTVKGIYSIDANEELIKLLNSKAHYIDVGGKNIRVSSNEAIQAIYNLTKVLSGTKLTDPIF